MPCSAAAWGVDSSVEAACASVSVDGDASPPACFPPQVLSPRHLPSQGVYRLCHPYPPGLKEVQDCRKTGFHPEHQRNGQNAGNGVYEECAHVQWTDAMIQVVDLRKGKH